MDVMRIKDETMVKMLNSLMSGTAKNFYLQHVTKKPSRWTIAKIIPALFDYCFLSNVLEQLRRKWDTVSQGK